MPDLSTYVIGCIVLGGLLLPLGWAAVEGRRWLVPGWRGTWARLVEAVLTAALVTVVAEALGTFGQLQRAPLFIGGLVVGCGLATGIRRLPRRPGSPADPAPLDRWAVGGAALTVVGVAAQWTAWTAQALRHGITAYDAVFYHGAVAVRFAQTGDVTRLHSIVPGEAVTFYPATAELWHAIGMVALRTDVLSPVLNLVALMVALLAAWCVGRSLGGGPAAVAGIALVLAMPYMAASRPGSSFNDAPALAALLASGALLSRFAAGRRFGGRRGAALVAAVAAGLAAGMKLSFVAPAALILLAATWLAGRGRRVATAAGWIAVMVIVGGYWYARNLVRVGNPIPGVSDGLPSAASVDQQYGGRLLTSLNLSSTGWRTVYRVGLHDYFGRVWPAMVLIVVVGIVTGLLVGARWHRAIAAVGLAAAVAYTVTPVTGDPAFFRFNLRYTLAIQGLAVLVLCTLPALLSKTAQRLLVAGSMVALFVVWPGPHRGASPFEIGGWPASDRVVAVAVCVAVLGLAAAVWRVLVVRRNVGVVLVGVALLTAIVAGRGVETRFLKGRYQHLPGELAPAWQWAQSVHGARIGVAGLYQQYPFAGRDLSNFVQYVGLTTPHGGLARAPTCAAWRQAVNAGHYQFIVTSREGIYPPPGEPAEAGWTRSARGARQIMRTGDTAVFAISGPLPTRC